MKDARKAVPWVRKAKDRVQVILVFVSLKNLGIGLNALRIVLTEAF
jgi:hypothetical protein